MGQKTYKQRGDVLENTVGGRDDSGLREQDSVAVGNHVDGRFYMATTS